MHEDLETDYLVVGAGAAGMAFVDELLAHSDTTIAIVDRNHAPGGHWIDAYPFVRLHQPRPRQVDQEDAPQPDERPRGAPRSRGREGDARAHQALRHAAINVQKLLG